MDRPTERVVVERRTVQKNGSRGKWGWNSEPYIGDIAEHLSAARRAADSAYRHGLRETRLEFRAVRHGEPWEPQGADVIDIKESRRAK